MVYDSQTFKALHELTPQGKESHQRILSDEADRLLFKHFHPVKYFLRWLKSTLGMDS